MFNSVAVLMKQLFQTHTWNNIIAQIIFIAIILDD